MPVSRYVLLVPVKPPAVGKSRLRGVADRRALAEAFALDTVAACLDADLVGRVLVVTDDAEFSAHLSALGASAIPDGVADDLNGTLRLAAAEARRRWPDLTPAALCADLPALRHDDLDEVLGRGTPEPWFVPDAARRSVP
ncbi:MAG: 2-phospho-L-lactate guanylyltransferase, partial [Actinomycetales bacterium]